MLSDGKSEGNCFRVLPPPWVGMAENSCVPRSKRNSEHDLSFPDPGDVLTQTPKGIDAGSMVQLFCLSLDAVVRRGFGNKLGNKRPSIGQHGDPLDGFRSGLGTTARHATAPAGHSALA